MCYFVGLVPPLPAQLAFGIAFADFVGTNAPNWSVQMCDGPKRIGHPCPIPPYLSPLQLSAFGWRCRNQFQLDEIKIIIRFYSWFQIFFLKIKNIFRDIIFFCQYFAKSEALALKPKPTLGHKPNFKS